LSSGIAQRAEVARSGVGFDSEEVVMVALGKKSKDRIFAFRCFPFRIVLITGALVLLGGCASGGAGLVRHSGPMKTDSTYVNAVEQVAKRRGVQIVWLNPPKRPARGEVTERE
jgi:hypothetical protein